MVEASGGSGDALAPTVLTEDNTAPTEAGRIAEMNAKTKADAIADARRGVESAVLKLERQQQHLEGAQLALERAQAELAVLEAEA